MYKHDILKNLCEISSPSSYEDNIRNYIISLIKNDVDSLYIDKMGNLIAKYNKSDNGLVYIAHMDEVGFIVKGITESGLIKIDQIGGIDEKFIASKRIKFSSEIIGIVTTVPVHFKTDKNLSFSDYYIDIGASTKEEAEKLTHIGDYGTFDTDFEFINDKSKIVCGKALDNRIGCYILISMIKSRKYRNCAFCFSVQEETGLRGANAFFGNRKFKVGVAVDTTTAFDIPGINGPKQVSKIGCGPVISFADRSTVYDNLTVSQIIDRVQSNNVPCQTKTFLSGGNDASAIQKAGIGHKAISISVPARGIHSNIGTASVSDIENTEKALSIIYEMYNNGEI